MSEKLLLQVLNEVKEMKGDISDMKSDIFGMKGDITNMKGDILGMKSDITNMKDDINRINDEIFSIKEEQIKTNHGLNHLDNKTDAIQEQTVKISENHAEVINQLHNKATKDDFNYLKEIVFKHDEEIYKIKSQKQA